MNRHAHFSGRVIFDHLPKTAGMAISAWLRSALGAGCVKADIIGTHRELIKQFGGEYSVISAHVGFQGEGLDPRYDYVTCFRHPVDRAVSWIFYVLQNDASQDMVDLRAGVQTFLRTEGEQGWCLDFNNNVTEHLCAINGFTSTDTDECLKYALSAVEEYALWGLYERLPEFVNDFSTFLEVPPPPQLDRVNITHKRPMITEITPRLRTRIEELNALDISLYDKLQANYNEARQRWLRPPAKVSRWQPLHERLPRRFSLTDFVLLSCRQVGGDNVNQYGVLCFELVFSLARPIDVLECGIHIHDETGTRAFGTNSTLCNTPIGPLSAGTHCVNHTIMAAFPEGEYSVGFGFAEKTIVGNHKLAWFEELAFFRIRLDRNPNCVGYVSVPTAICAFTLGGEIVALPTVGIGHIQFNTESSQVFVGGKYQLSLVLYNESNQDWVGTVVHPLRLGARWLDDVGCTIVLDGFRAEVPGNKLVAGQSVEIELSIYAPDTPGQYTLKILPVSEFHAWFDLLGFTPGLRSIEVVGCPVSTRTE